MVRALIKHAFAHTQRIGQMRRNAAEWPNAPDTDMEEWQLTSNDQQLTLLPPSGIIRSDVKYFK